MEVRYNVTGARRRELAQVISKITKARAEYQYMPTCAYEIDLFMLTKDGTLEYSDSSDSEIVKQVLDGIAAAGFESEAAVTEETESTDTDEENSDEPVGLTISVPLEAVDLGNLTNLLEAKGDLIKKALGIDDLPIEIEEDEVVFPWFKDLQDFETSTTYTNFIAALCRMSKEQKRINASSKPVENEKYAFRCFLLRLDFIGPEYKKDRKILLRNFSGSSAYKGGTKNAE